MKLHPDKGHLWLCGKCHEKSDEMQLKMVLILANAAAKTEL
jgi:hypothetical protein